MTLAHKTIGARIVLKDKMFAAPFAPNYDSERGVIMEVVNGKVHPGHIQVKRLDTGEAMLLHVDEVRTARDDELRAHGLI